MSAAYFFAYGVEVASQAMGELLGRPVQGTRALLQGYRIAFTTYSDQWEGGVADVVADLEGEVEGVVYPLTARDFLRLDVVQGWQDPLYRRLMVRVELEDGRHVEAMARKVGDKQASVPPAPAYLDAMIQGGTEQGLSDGYLAWLLQLYPDPAAPRTAQRTPEEE